MKIFALAALLGAASMATAAPAFDSFMDYCKEDNNSDMALYTLDVLGEMAGSTRCHEIEAYLNKQQDFKLAAPGITEVTALKFFDNITSLTLESRQPVRLGQLKGMKNLANLKVIAPVKAAGTISTALKELELTGAAGVDLTGIAGNTALSHLALHKSPGVDLGALELVATLRTLTINTSELANLAPIAALPQIGHFIAEDNLIADLTPLAAHPGIFALNLTHNKVASLSALKDNANLEYLELDGNPLGTSVPKNASNCPQKAASPAVAAWCAK